LALNHRCSLSTCDTINRKLTHFSLSEWPGWTSGCRQRPERGHYPSGRHKRQPPTRLTHNERGRTSHPRPFRSRHPRTRGRTLPPLPNSLHRPKQRSLPTHERRSSTCKTDAARPAALQQPGLGGSCSCGRRRRSCRWDRQRLQLAEPPAAEQLGLWWRR